MPRFEVFVPAAPPRVPAAVTLRIEAEHWLAALKAGLQRIGDEQLASNVLCDIQPDGSIHVTDPKGGRSFRIVDLSAPGGPALTPSPFPVTPPVPRPGRPSAQADRVEEARQPAVTPVQPIGRAAEVVDVEDVLADLFQEVSQLAGISDRKKGLGFLLDTAMSHIGCEAGTVFTTGLGRSDLSFEVVRGPSADKLLALKLTVPMGVGVVGYCAQENTCLAVSDAEKNPHFYRKVSEATGYQTRSLLCAPMARDGQVLGALEVVNKKGNRPFDQRDLAILAYLAAQAAGFLARVSR